MWSISILPLFWRKWFSIGLVRFGIVDVKNVYVAKISELLAKATGPVYKKISEKVPAVSGFDFSPFILLLVLLFLGRFIYRLDLMLMS